MDEVDILLDEVSREGGGVGDGGVVAGGVEVSEFGGGPIGVVEKVKFRAVWCDEGDGRVLGHSNVMRGKEDGLSVDPDGESEVEMGVVGVLVESEVDGENS